MLSKVTVVCSTTDRASQNIKHSLLKLRKWDVKQDVFEFRNFRIIEVHESLVYQDDIDKRLMDKSLPTDLIIFASRHRSKDERAILTVHSTGNVGEARLGGKEKQLASPAPYALRSLLRSLKTLAENQGYEVTLECTHHGPSNVEIPSVFIEIGSNERQWEDGIAGNIVANAILELKEEKVPVAVGFGGTHYAPRQTSLTLEAGITFGHIFPTYVLDKVDEDIVQQAFDKSKADFAYIDRKSMKAEQRRRLSAIIEKLGYAVLREREIRERT